MPVQRVKGRYQWGEAGKLYPSKKQALKQGLAIMYSQAKKGRKLELK
jgi:hypothetical protein